MTRIIILFIAVSASGQALSLGAWIKGTVNRTLLQEGAWGLCMANIVPGPETVLPSCAEGWVTFSCSGDFNSKSAGNLKFQSAQLAFITGKELDIAVEDTKRHNGYCFAVRVDVLK